MFSSHTGLEKMGCCFSKELNPSLQNERSSLLQPPRHDGLNEVTEQVRQQAAAIAQHVCTEEEERCVPNGPAQWKPVGYEERHPELEIKVWTEEAVVISDGTMPVEGDPKPGSTHKEAIIITTSTNMHTNRDTAADVTLAVSPSCEPAPYMVVPTKSPVKQKILENATRRALWFNQLPERQKHCKPAGCWSGPARLPSANCQGNTSEVSDDQPLPISACQGKQQDDEHQEENGEEACVVATTLGQDFAARTQSFYSICSIDANDLDHDHDNDHSQSQTAGVPQSLQTAEVKTAALPCEVESPVSNQSNNEASTACDQMNIMEPKMTSQSHDEEPAFKQSHDAELSSMVLLQEYSDSSLSVEQTTIPHPVVSPQLVDPPCDLQSFTSSPVSSQDPQATACDSPDITGDFSQTAKFTDESMGDILPKAIESTCVDKSECVEGESVKGSEEMIITEECIFVKNVHEECVCSGEQAVYPDDPRAAGGVFTATKEASVIFQENKSDSSVDSHVNPLNCLLNDSEHVTEEHIQSSQAASETPELDSSSQSPSYSNLDFKVLHKEEDILPLPGGQIELDKSSLQSEAFPVGGCRGQSEGEDDGHYSATDPNLTEVSSVSTISAASSLSSELNSFSCQTKPTAPPDFSYTLSNHCDSSTSDELDSTDPTSELISIVPLQDVEPSEKILRYDDKIFDADVETVGGVISLQNCSVEPFQDVPMSEDDGQVVEKIKSEKSQNNNKSVVIGDLTVSRPEMSDENCNLLPECGYDCMAGVINITPQDYEEQEKSIEDFRDSLFSEPPPAKGEQPVPSFCSPHPASTSVCTSFEEIEPSFSSDTEATDNDNGCNQLPLKVNQPEKVCEEGSVTTVAQGSPIDQPLSMSDEHELSNTAGQPSHSPGQPTHSPGQHSHSPEPASDPTDVFTDGLSSDCLLPDFILQHETDRSFEPADSSDGILLDNIIEMPEEEQPALVSGTAPETPMFTVSWPLSESVEVFADTSICDTFMIPNATSCQDDRIMASECQEDNNILVDPGQIDFYASTPSYEIHCLGHDLSAAAEEGEREGGMREMVSELLGENADSSVYCLYPHPWIKLGLEESCGGWAQGMSEAEPSKNDSKMGTDTEHIPASVSELQPSMALLGAYPFSTVMPQGSCVWDWHTDCTQSVSVHSTHGTKMACHVLVDYLYNDI